MSASIIQTSQLWQDTASTSDMTFSSRTPITSPMDYIIQEVAEIQLQPKNMNMKDSCCG
jgi:hypothetical protein